jgi:hypothetical protein
MTPEQQESYNAILGMARRVAAHIEELPLDQRAVAVKAAQQTMMESVTEHGITDPDLVNIFAVGIALVLHEEQSQDNP